MKALFANFCKPVIYLAADCEAECLKTSKKIYCVFNEKLQFDPTGALANLARSTLLIVMLVDGKNTFAKRYHQRLFA